MGKRRGPAWNARMGISGTLASAGTLVVLAAITLLQLHHDAPSEQQWSVQCPVCFSAAEASQLGTRCPEL